MCVLLGRDDIGWCEVEGVFLRSENLWGLGGFEVSEIIEAYELTILRWLRRVL